MFCYALFWFGSAFCVCVMRGVKASEIEREREGAHADEVTMLLLNVSIQRYRTVIYGQKSASIDVTTDANLCAFVKYKQMHTLNSTPLHSPFVSQPSVVLSLGRLFKRCTFFVVYVWSVVIVILFFVQCVFFPRCLFFVMHRLLLWFT